MKLKDCPIGIFDSGIGGMTVVKEVIKQLPNEEIIYLGDTLRVPYGPKDKETIYKYSKEIVEFLIKNNVKCIVIACNTISVVCYKKFIEEFDIGIVEIISPAIKKSVEVTKNGNIGIAATETTVLSKEHEIRIKHQNENLNVYLAPCPLFVNLVEEGWMESDVAKLTSKIYLQDLCDNDIDTLVLGCTHYPFLINSIRAAVGGNVNIINPSELVCIELKKFLKENDLERSDESRKVHKLFATGNIEKFKKICNKVIDFNCNSDFEIGKIVL